MHDTVGHHDDGEQQPGPHDRATCSRQPVGLAAQAQYCRRRDQSRPVGCGRTEPLTAEDDDDDRTVWRVIALATNGHDLFVDEAQYGAWARGLEAGYCSKRPMLA